MHLHLNILKSVHENEERHLKMTEIILGNQIQFGTHS